MYRAEKNIDDIKYIIDNLRLEDKEEVQRLLGEEWKQKTLDNIINTDFYVLIGKSEVGDVPVVIGGAWETDLNNKGVACVWLLCTSEVENHQISLIREMKKEFKKYDSEYWLLYNIMYKKNYSAKNWLKYFGFKFDIPHPENINLPKDFDFFYRIRDVKGLV